MGFPPYQNNVEGVDIVQTTNKLLNLVTKVIVVSDCVNIRSNRVPEAIFIKWLY